jgi:hypothetical protein
MYNLSVRGYLHCQCISSRLDLESRSCKTGAFEAPTLSDLPSSMLLSDLSPPVTAPVGACSAPDWELFPRHEMGLQVRCVRFYVQLPGEPLPTQVR